MIALIALQLMQRFALDPRKAKVIAWALIIALIVAALSIAKCTYDRNLIADHDAKVTTKTLTTDTKAKADAAEQRGADTIAIDTAEKERNDAINAAPAARPDDARNRLNCDRLRRAGKDTSGYPACR